MRAIFIYPFLERLGLHIYYLKIRLSMLNLSYHQQIKTNNELIPQTNIPKVCQTLYTVAYSSCHTSFVVQKICKIFFQSPTSALFTYIYCSHVFPDSLICRQGRIMLGHWSILFRLPLPVFPHPFSSLPLSFKMSSAPLD